MNRVTKRTWIMGLFLAVLLGGMMFFLWEYVGPNYNVLYIAAENLRSCYWAVEELTHGTLTVRKSFIDPDLVTSGDYSERIRFSAVR